MKKSILLAHSNLRRAKGQMAAIAVLMLLASFMLNLWLMLATDYKQNFDRCHNRLNAEHVILAADSTDAKLRSILTDTLETDRRTAAYQLDDAMDMAGSFTYHGGEITTNFIILPKEKALSRTIGKTELVEDSSYTSGIYLPMLYKTEETAVGKAIALTIGNHTLNYTVCGFFNNVMAGSHNCSLCLIMLTQDKYEELKHLGYAPASTLVSVRIFDKSQSEDFQAMLNDTVSGNFPDTRILSNSYTLVAQSRYISQMICSGIVSAMAFFVLLIALAVIASNIINYIQENMKNLGALKAIGYTSGQLVRSLLLQFLGICLAAASVGAALSYGLFPPVNTLMVSQTGIPYAVHFLPLPFAATLALLNGAAALTVWLSARKIKKIEPITALRQGIQTHNFKRNHIPLESSRAPLHLALALKTAYSGAKQNLTISITMLILSLVTVFSGVMVKNVISDMTPFLNLVVGETADSCINIDPEFESEFLQAMQSDKRVENIYLYHSEQIQHVGGIGLTATFCDDFSKVNNPDVCLKGRFPKYDNEMAIAVKYAGEHGLQIGDEITLSAYGKEARYLICGFTQISNNLGKDCLLARNGYERLGHPDNLSYYLNLAKNVSIDHFNEEINAAFGGSVNATLNVSSIIDGSSSVYVALMEMIVTAVSILSILIIVFVLYLLVRTMLNNKKRDYGVLKALGYTTWELIVQTAASFMPAVILSTVVGLAVSCLLINPLIGVFLSGIGIVECSFAVPAGFVVAAGAGLCVFAFAAACLLAARIRKIVPKELLAGE